MKSENPSDQSDWFDSSDPSDLHHLLPKHGGYRKLRSFQAAQLVYDATLIFCERLHAVRVRSRPPQPFDRPDVPIPACPRCNQPMRIRTARQGSKSGQIFCGCAAYPGSTGTRPFESLPWRPPAALFVPHFRFALAREKRVNVHHYRRQAPLINS